jgi:hypothetical protein
MPSKKPKWPISSSSFGLSASRLSLRSPWPRRSWPLTWRGRRGGLVVERRDSFFLDEIVAYVVIVKSAVFNGESYKFRNLCFGHFNFGSVDLGHFLDLGICLGLGEVAIQLNAISSQLATCVFSDDAVCFHFAFSFRPDMGLVLFSVNTIPNRLAIVNRKKRDFLRFFIVRNRRHLRRAAARTQNTRITDSGKV